MKTVLRKIFLFGLIPHAVLLLGLTFPYNLVLLVLGLFNVIPLWIGILHTSVSIVAWFITVNFVKKSANNTYFCITEKQVIKRSGIFANKYKRFSLTNIGTVEVNANIYDSKEKPESTTLSIFVKNFTNGISEQKLTVSNLSDAYTAYKIIANVTDGEAVKIKQI